MDTLQLVGRLDNRNRQAYSLGRKVEPRRFGVPRGSGNLDGTQGGKEIIHPSVKDRNLARQVSGFFVCPEHS